MVTTNFYQRNQRSFLEKRIQNKVIKLKYLSLFFLKEKININFHALNRLYHGAS